MLTNRRLFPIYALAFVVALVFVHCGGSDETTEPVDPLAGAALCLSDSSCAMGAVCDTSSAIDVTNCGNSAVLSWTAADDAAWLSLSVASGETPAQLCLMADSNRTGTERTATVTVTADDLTDESIDIAVSQPTLGPTLHVSLSEWEAYCLGDTSDAISVANTGNDAPIDWVVTEEAEWLELSVASGSTPGNFTITADTNDTQEGRTATITVIAEGVAGSPWEITVVQSCVMALVGSYNIDAVASGVFVTGHYAYVAHTTGGLEIILVYHPSSPALAGSYDTDGEAQGVFVTDDYAYVADGDAGLQVVNVSNPFSPTLTGSYDTDGEAQGVFVTGDYAYVADQGGGLQIIDVSDPSSPTLAGSCDTDGNVLGVFVTDDYAYVADAAGLQIIDVSNPSSPTLTGSCNTDGVAYGVFVTGDYAYVADWFGGLQIIDVSDPFSPTLTGSYDTGGAAFGVFVTGDYAYVANFEAGLQIIDVSDPSSPALAGSCDTDGSALGVFVTGDYAYLAMANDVAGLLIFEIGL